MARKAVDQELSRFRIMEVARNLFATKGYREVSMRCIGQELGYSHGSLYYHFKDKAELFCALVAQDYILLNKLLSDVLTEAPEQGMTRLEMIMLKFIRFGLEYPNHYEIMFLIADADLKKYSEPEQRLLYERFSSLVWEASGRTCDKANNYAYYLFLSMHGFVTHHVHGTIPYDQIELTAREHVKFLCRGLS
ncbi:TetR family transcriptional regulator [Paenibacillus swuensis]|uniref:TetR family transcriptional regulator n=1 Tax=Paenibacillus swuensis TaxID=1178515 RepID=A0A172TP17_9BACL|nr:TetR/AcrR family transcriptional regulator [Paenibacillus swuensis]ANE48805.1 TetR family transcriptional regulator [Paenibacillus swuensis]